MEKEKALEYLLKEGYNAFVENSILMVGVPETYTESDMKALQEELATKLKKIDYDASWGIVYKKETVSDTAGAVSIS